MFVKLLASATAASAVVLRGMSYDTTNNKVVMKNHGLSDGDKLYFEKGTDGTVQGGLAENEVYVVFGQTDQGFQLKAAAADLTAGTLITLTADTSGHTANTFTKVGTTGKIAEIKNTSTNTLTLAAAPAADMATTDAYVFYCHDRATTACAVTTDGTAVANADIADTKVVYPQTTLDHDNADAALKVSLKVAKTQGGAALTWTDPGADRAVTGVLWALQKTTTVKYALVTGSWDATNNKAKALHPFANNDIVFYKASTVNTGLQNNGVYTAVVANLNNSEFSLKGNHATTYANDAPYTADSVDVTFTGVNGVGGTFTKIAAGDNTKNKVLSGAATDDKWTLGATDHVIVADDEVIFYCSDKETAANCAFAPLVDGTSYKAKTVATNTVILKGTTGTANIDIATDVAEAATNKGWLLEKAMYATATDGAVEVTVVPAPAGASAARGLAMFGSVVAMGAAFLMA
jgi:hypothetical protein